MSPFKSIALFVLFLSLVSTNRDCWAQKNTPSYHLIGKQSKYIELTGPYDTVNAELYTRAIRVDSIENNRNGWTHGTKIGYLQKLLYIDQDVLTIKETTYSGDFPECAIGLETFSMSLKTQEILADSSVFAKEGYLKTAFKIITTPLYAPRDGLLPYIYRNHRLVVVSDGVYLYLTISREGSQTCESHRVKITNNVFGIFFRKGVSESNLKTEVR